MFGRISTAEIIIIAVILLLFFGARRLPDIARSLGESAREFRKSIRNNDEEKPHGGEDA